MNKTAFVTGGTGFVGSHLAEELLQRNFAEVRCLVRSDPKWLADLDATQVSGDLSDIEALWTALDGVTHVYHLAGRTRAPDWDSFYEANVQGTLNLLGAVKHAAPNVERILLTSSLAAVGRCDGGIATEESPLQSVSAYGRSKAEMERSLRQSHEMNQTYAEALPITVVRPSAVYGPRDRDLLDYFSAVKRHVAPLPGVLSQPGFSLVHVRDLATGMVDASLHPNALNETYLLGSEHPYAWREVKQAAVDALDTWAMSVPIPGPLIQLSGAMAEAWGALTGRYPPFNRDKARELRHACTACSIEKARSHFNYAPDVPLDEGVRQTVQWYDTRGWL